MSSYFNRRDKIVEVLQKVGIKGAIIIEEKVDPQFKAIQMLPVHLKAKLAVANALVSYQLSGKGEEYWLEFGEKLRKATNWKEIFNFLHTSQFNRRLVKQKIKRLKRATSIIERVNEMTTIEVWYKVGKIFGKHKKTVVFAVKMLGYAERHRIPYPMQIPIPVDSRIKRLTPSNDPIIFWQKIAEEAEIPPLHLDSILWNYLGNKKAVLNLFPELKILDTLKRFKNENKDIFTE